MRKPVAGGFGVELNIPTTIRIIDGMLTRDEADGRHKKVGKEGFPPSPPGAKPGVLINYMLMKTVRCNGVCAAVNSAPFFGPVDPAGDTGQRQLAQCEVCPVLGGSNRLNSRVPAG